MSTISQKFLPVDLYKFQGEHDVWLETLTDKSHAGLAWLALDYKVLQPNAHNTTQPS